MKKTERELLLIELRNCIAELTPEEAEQVSLYVEKLQQKQKQN